VVEVDADLAVVVALVAEGVLDLGHAAILGRVEVVLAHRLRRVAVEVDLVVVEDNLLPAIAARAERKAVVLGEAALDVVGADEVGHGAGAGRAEGIDGRLGRLEEHVDRLAVDGVAVAVELGGGALGLRLEVAAVEVRLRDAHDRVAPVALRGHDLIHRDRRLGADLLRARVGQRRVVEVDADLAVVVALVAEGVLDLCGGAAIRRVEVVLAHRLRSVAVEVDLVVVEDHLLPADATRAKGEALVLSIAARQHLVAANEIRQSALCRRAEGRVGGLGRLEEHVRAAVAVQLVRGLRGLGDEVTAAEVRVRDAHESIAPVPLRRDDLFQRDRRRGRRRRDGERAKDRTAGESERSDDARSTRVEQRRGCGGGGGLDLKGLRRGGGRSRPRGGLGPSRGLRLENIIVRPEIGGHLRGPSWQGRIRGLITRFTHIRGLRRGRTRRHDCPLHSVGGHRFFLRVAHHARGAGRRSAQRRRRQLEGQSRRDKREHEKRG